MKNMVWKYCRSISPEWKHQVRRAGSGAWTGQGVREAVGTPRRVLARKEHFSPGGQHGLRWVLGPVCPRV